MKARFSLLPVRTLIGLLVTAPVFSVSQAPAQQTEVTTLYEFTGGSDGSYPGATVRGSDGNFYGVAGDATKQTDGIVYRITPDGKETSIYAFPKTSGGTIPGAKLIQAKDGNFYGVTASGGTNGIGSVFQLTPAGTLTTIHSFGGSEPTQPTAGLIQGSDGNLYGTASRGGSDGEGGVFKMTTDGTLTTLHHFGEGTDGVEPTASLVEVGSGKFYGTTSSGGDSIGASAGTVFVVSSAGAFSTVHFFDDTNAGDPLFPTSAALVLGGDGNLYGTTLEGPGKSRGSVYRVTPYGAVTVLHSFTDQGDGYAPEAGLVLGSDGNLYGTTNDAGDTFGSKVYRVSLSGDFTTLYSFEESNTDLIVQGTLIPTSDGAFYGTTLDGGTRELGTLFKLTFHPAFFDGEVELSDQVYYLAFSASGNPFGYYAYLSDPHFIYHFDLGYEYVFGAGDGKDGVYFYDFKSKGYFYTSPTFPFPYLYDFTLKTVLYYYPDPKNAGHYNTDGVRYFYDFANGKIITK